MLPGRCFPNPLSPASSGSGPLPGKWASLCASRCTAVRYQVSTIEISVFHTVWHWQTRLYLAMLVCHPNGKTIFKCIQVTDCWWYFIYPILLFGKMGKWYFCTGLLWDLFRPFVSRVTYLVDVVLLVLAKMVYYLTVVRAQWEKVYSEESAAFCIMKERHMKVITYLCYLMFECTSFNMDDFNSKQAGRALGAGASRAPCPSWVLLLLLRRHTHTHTHHLHSSGPPSCSPLPTPLASVSRYSDPHQCDVGTFPPTARLWLWLGSNGVTSLFVMHFFYGHVKGVMCVWGSFSCVWNCLSASLSMFSCFWMFISICPC